MTSRSEKTTNIVLVADSLASLALWVLLIILKSVGVIRMHWAVVLSGIVWISWSAFAITAFGALFLGYLAKLKRRHRRRNVDSRVIRQAKAAGVWDKPELLGGRALELRAWQDFNIRRQPGETDAELRSRYKRDEFDAYAYSIAKVYDYETAKKAKGRRKK